MSEPTIRELISKSSLGGSAWCQTCKHPDLLHESYGCIGSGLIDNTDTVACGCPKLRRMTADEWSAWQDALRDAMPDGET